MARKNHQNPKQPRTAEVVSSGKVARHIPVRYEGSVSVQFGYIDWDGDFGWNQIGEQDLKAIIRFIVDVETQDFEHFKVKAKKNHHTIEKSALSAPALKRLRQIKRDDLDEVFSFKVSGEKRVIGVLNGTIFKVLWWDPLHQVCISKKKHT